MKTTSVIVSKKRSKGLTNIWKIKCLIYINQRTLRWVPLQSAKKCIHDRVQPKTSPCSTRHLIWLNYKVVSKLYKLILLSFSYLNSSRHFSVIELCCEPFFQLKKTVLEKIDLQFFCYWFSCFFKNSDFHIYFSRDLTVMWQNKKTSLSK